MFKFMLDANVFDFIIENNFSDLVKKLVEKKLIGLYITHVQKDQLDAINDPDKKHAIESIPVRQLLLSVGWSADENQKGGFKGPRTNNFRSVDDIDAKILEECLQNRTNRSQRIFGDIGIIYTAIQENMNYVVSDDRDLRQFYECLKDKIQNKLKFQSAEEFSSFLSTLKTTS